MPPDPTPHPDDAVLVDLATGGEAHPAAAEHVGSCPRCSEELARVSDVLGLVRDGAPDLVPAPPGVWSAVVAELDEASPPHVAPAARPADDVPVDLVGRRPTRASRVPAWWLLGAAAAGIVLGGVGRGVLDGGTPTPEPTTVLARTSLDTLDSHTALGSADAVRVEGHLDLDVSTARLDPGAGYLEVWLINRDLTRMVSVGVLRADEGTQRFAIDQELIDEGYVIVDISREGFDDRPEHSGDSLARGTLAL